jgi:DNA ligase (NAD+)
MMVFKSASEETPSAQNDKIFGQTFVITGKLNSYSNRDALKSEIESLGGKVTGSISSKTNYLINNDITSTSAKNQKAKSLGIPIISEEDYKKFLKNN